MSDLNSFIEECISEYIQQLSRSRRYTKFDETLSDCFGYVYNKLATANKNKWKNDSMKIEKFLAIIRDGERKKQALYRKISRNLIWNDFSAKRALEKKKTLQAAKDQKILTRTPLVRRKYSDIREEVLFNNIPDEPIVVKSRRLSVEHIHHHYRLLQHAETTTMNFLKDSRNPRLANLTDSVIESPWKRKELRKWLIRNRIVAVTMINLQWLRIPAGSTAVGSGVMKTRFMALLDVLIGTSVFAANFGENIDIAQCEPFECLCDHILKDDGPIRRYFICEITFPKATRIASNFPSSLLHKVREEKKEKRGAWMAHAEDDKAWDAVAKSNAVLGRRSVTQSIAKRALK